MDSNVIELPPDLAARCLAFAEQSVGDYRAGRKNESLQYATHGMERNICGQADAKGAECAFALWAGLDPERAIDWTVKPDAGADVIYRWLRVDVKQTGPASQFLLWPASKVGCFKNKGFDIFSLVKGEGRRFTIAGWIPKDLFFFRHLVAPAGWKISAGTWYLHEHDLFCPDDLIAFALAGTMPRGLRGYSATLDIEIAP